MHWLPTSFQGAAGCRIAAKVAANAPTATPLHHVVLHSRASLIADASLFSYANMTSQIMATDPYLAYRPTFAYSVPIQILVEGITLTLVTVLLIHLLFTTQYHWPLSKTNYCLQLSGILCLLCSSVATIVTVLQVQSNSADEWPYMLDYIEVNVPGDTWTDAQNGAWSFLTMVVNLLVQFTHIQFLTLLFPSSTEVKLIFFMLGPLALCSSGLYFSQLSEDRTTLDLGDAIRNVFDSTLLLMFSIGVIIWGVLVNRSRAWRLDGGTAIFGAGAITLALASTAGNFVKIREDGLLWLQNMIWAIVLWQSWLGFWWWVGSGMGIGEVEDMVRREERKRLKQQQHQRGRTRRSAAATTTTAHRGARQKTSDDEPELAGGRSTALEGLLDRVRSNVGRSFRQRRHNGGISRGADPATATEAEEIELRDLAETHEERRQQRRQRRGGEGDEADPETAAAGPDGDGMPPRHATFTSSSRRGEGTVGGGTREMDSSSSSNSALPLESVSGILGYPINFILRFFRRLRSGHEEATKEQVIKRVEARKRAFQRSGQSGSLPAHATTGGAAGTATPRRDPSAAGGAPTGPTPAEAGAALSSSSLPALRPGHARFGGHDRRSSLGFSDGRHVDMHHVLGQDEDLGWGLGSFGLREAAESERRLREARERVRGERLLRRRSTGDDQDDDDDLGRYRGDSSAAGPSRRMSEATDLDDLERGDGSGRGVVEHRRRQQHREEAEDEWIDEEILSDAPTPHARGGRRSPPLPGDSSAHDSPPIPPANHGAGGQGWTWRGPIREWRLADRTTY